MSFDLIKQRPSENKFQTAFLRFSHRAPECRLQPRNHAFGGGFGHPFVPRLNQAVQVGQRDADLRRRSLEGGGKAGLRVFRPRLFGLLFLLGAFAVNLPLQGDGLPVSGGGLAVALRFGFRQAASAICTCTASCLTAGTASHEGNAAIIQAAGTATAQCTSLIFNSSIFTKPL